MLLSTPQAAQPVLERLRDDDLADPRARFVVATVRRMIAEGVPPDLVTFPAFVDRHALLEPGPGRTHLRSHLHEIADAAPVVASLGWYADAVIVQAVRRRGAESGERLARLARGADLDEYRDAVRAEAVATLDDLDRSGAGAVAVSVDV